jgi:hypothetical protein
MFENANQQRTRKSVYEQWVEQEGLPLVQGHYIPDLKTADVVPWARRNALGCFINHDASNTSTTATCWSWRPARRPRPSTSSTRR